MTHDNRNDNRGPLGGNRNGISRQTMVSIAIGALLIIGILAYYFTDQRRNTTAGSPGTTTSTPGTTTIPATTPTKK